MLCPAFRRAIQPVCTTCSTSTQIANRPPALATITAAAQNFTSRPLHQRRHSSSKASSPPDENAKTVPAPSSQSAKSHPSEKAPTKRTTGRNTRKKATAPPSVNIPKVPATTHLNEKDVYCSSWFAMHRPISVTHPVPVMSNTLSFNSMFDPTQDKLSDVVYTLSDAIESLEAAGQFRMDVDAQDSVSQSVHAAGQLGSPISVAELDQLLAQCVPFKPPPPPMPVGEMSPKRKSTARKADRTRVPKQKSWRVSVNVTESTDSNGDRRYLFEASEPQEIQNAIISLENVATNSEQRSFTASQPFLRRMRARHAKWLSSRPISMQLISVKRQRKLKMKKHKYKKLMKRTRNLRRKLERN